MEKTPTVFIVSSDAAVLDSVRVLGESAGLRAETLPTLEAFLAAVEPGRQGCLVLDAQISEFEDVGQEARLARACERMPAVLITDRGDVPAAVRALKAGAMDVVEKPTRDDKLLARIERALAADAAARG